MRPANHQTADHQTVDAKTIHFQISGLDPSAFEGLFALGPDELKSRDARRVEVTAKPGFPCRVSLQDAEPGETVILFTHTHHDVDSPYRASGPIYVRQGVPAARLTPDELPAVVAGRKMSLRAYSAKGMMRSAAVCDGEEMADEIRRLFADPKVAYLHAHNALPGCFSCRIDRAG